MIVEPPDRIELVMQLFALLQLFADRIRTMPYGLRVGSF